MLDLVSDDTFITMETIEADLRRHAQRISQDLHGEVAIDIDWRKPSNHEGTLIDYVEEALRKGCQAIIINPAKLAYYGLSLAAALEVASLHAVVVEVHLSNSLENQVLAGRSRITEQACDRIIAGLGPRGYLYALEEAVRLVMEDKQIPDREKVSTAELT